MVVSKEVKRLREHEAALLRGYQALLKALLEVGGSAVFRTRVGATAAGVSADAQGAAGGAPCTLGMALPGSAWF